VSRLLSRRFVVATAVAGVGVLGLGVAGAVGGSSSGPSDNAGNHPSAHATDTTLPAAASTGPENVPTGPENAASANTGVPAAGVAPSASELATALDATGDTPGNTVLNILIETAPGPDRGQQIASTAQTFGAEQSADAPEAPQAENRGTSTAAEHRP
jgi:hypothetical protein